MKRFLVVWLLSGLVTAGAAGYTLNGTHEPVKLATEIASESELHSSYNYTIYRHSPVDLELADIEGKVSLMLLGSSYYLAPDRGMCYFSYDEDAQLLKFYSQRYTLELKASGDVKIYHENKCYLDEGSYRFTVESAEGISSWNCWGGMFVRSDKVLDLDYVYLVAEGEGVEGAEGAEGAEGEGAASGVDASGVDAEGTKRTGLVGNKPIPKGAMLC